MTGQDPRESKATLSGHFIYVIKVLFFCLVYSSEKCDLREIRIGEAIRRLREISKTVTLPMFDQETWFQCSSGFREGGLRMRDKRCPYHRGLQNGRQALRSVVMFPSLRY